MQAAVVLMRGASVAGKTKTKLNSHLKAEECAALDKAFLKDMNFKLLNLKKSCSKLELFLSYKPEQSPKIFAEVIAKDFIRIPQRGESCGEIMYNAVTEAYQKSKLPVVIVGSNFPLLATDTFTEAFAGLKERDIVIGPSVDGSYYLLGMKKPEESLFYFKDWRKQSILEKTIKAASQHNLKIHFLPEAAEINTFKELLRLRFELIGKNIDSNYLKNTRKIIDELFIY
ncbi:DUF2064 domain-containing protein [Halanaerobium sp. ST460_2HS_T2]|uniref:TIGR04282 family arsenosugar biosynthesis glycosyltransferase n=1 Tax=Halanaerobium sp. ST460_2HS_T2 TaxID=2183914 RepID=UPI000DF285BD|nr:DUF2064 domain-containing protein [Halanaerobium sp. ST460_2HS_T2]RCW56541.1 hypothetical protein DFR80_11453 [Halanaerobium sp. ST460_2HS_T2]